MDAFLEQWVDTHREEGGHVKNPLDSGGETNHGIIVRVARAHGYMGDMKDLPVERARQIAKEQYWDIMRLDDVAALSRPIAGEMFDTGFLCGHANSVKFFQRCLNVGNRRQAFYPDVIVDGLMGRLSIYSFSKFLQRRGKDGETVLLRALNSLQGWYLTDLAERREKDEEFWFGWMLNRVQI